MEQQETEVPEEYEAYIGSWSMTTTHVFNWKEDPANPGYVLPSYTERSLTFSVEIAWDGVNQVLIITGISPLDAYLGALPAVITKFDDGNMYICGMVTLNYDLSQIASQLAGYKLTWLGIADLGEEGISPLSSTSTTAVYQLVLNGNSMTGTGAPVSVGMSDGSTLDTYYIAIDILPVSGNSMTILVSEDDDIPAGTLTFAKTGNSVSAQSSINVLTSVLSRNVVASMAVPMTIE